MHKWTAIQTCLGHLYQQYSLGCSVNSMPFHVIQKIALWNIPWSRAHLINPLLPVHRQGFPLSFSRIHLDLWLTYSMGTGWNHINCHCPSSVALVSVVNEWKYTLWYLTWDLLPCFPTVQLLSLCLGTLISGRRLKVILSYSPVSYSWLG